MTDNPLRRSTYINLHENSVAFIDKFSILLRCRLTSLVFQSCTYKMLYMSGYTGLNGVKVIKNRNNTGCVYGAVGSFRILVWQVEINL